MARIQIRYSDGRTHAFELTDGRQWFIGRDASCEICLDDAVTSRRHARLYRDGRGHYWIQDLRSKNGTLVNDQAAATIQVRSGDRIGIGGCLLLLDGDEAKPDESSVSIVLSDAASDTTRGTTTAWGRQQAVDLAHRRLQTLYELNERLTGRLNRDDLLGELLDICVEHLRFERAGIAVWMGDPQPPQWVRIVNTGEDAGGEIRLSRSIVDRALHHGERILITDTGSGDFDPTASIIANRIRSAMCVPMEYHGEVRGVVYGDRVSSTGGYRREDIDFLAALGRLGAMGLVNVRLAEELRERQRIEMQLHWARQIQSQLFPAEPLVAGGVTIDALNDPGQRVSGDYYDFFVRPDGRIALIIADVAGKGPAAALLMANLQAAVHLTLERETDLLKAAAVFNQLICRNGQVSKFITGIFGLIDPRAKTLHFVNAGHPPPFVLRRGGSVAAADGDGTPTCPGSDAGGTPTHPVAGGDGSVASETDHCLPLGVEPDARYFVNELRFDDGPATLVFYTDGVPDAENPSGESFGEPRFVDVLKDLTDQPPGEVVTRARRAVKQFARNHPQTDDITLLSVHFE